MFWTIFDRTDMKISLYRVVFRVEFDGDVRFFLAPPKSMFLLISIDFFDVFCNFFVFQVFVKILIFFFRAAAEPKSLPPRPRPPPPRRWPPPRRRWLPRRFVKLILTGSGVLHPSAKLTHKIAAAAATAAAKISARRRHGKNK